MLDDAQELFLCTGIILGGAQENIRGAGNLTMVGCI